MCGSPSVGSQLYFSGVFMCSPVAVFSSSPSQLLARPCTGASPACQTLPRTFFGHSQKGEYSLNKKGFIHLVVEAVHWCSWIWNPTPIQPSALSLRILIVAQMSLFPYQSLAYSQGELFPCPYA